MKLTQKQGRLKTLEVYPRCTQECLRCISFEYSALRNPKTGMSRVAQGRLKTIKKTSVCRVVC